MDEALQIFDYLPLSFKVPSEQEYINFLWESFEVNYNAEKYPFAFIAFNMLYMSFIYFEIWQIKESRRKDFEMAMVGFDLENENHLINASSPFAFWKIKEKSFFRFLKLLNCDNDRIGSFAKIIESRNDAAHSNGNIFFNSQIAIDEKLAEVIRNVQAIQTLSKPAVESSFVDFLKSSWNPDEREYFDDEEQIKEALVHKNYHSQKDINFLRGFRISSLSNEDHHEEMKNLFYFFRNLYKPDEETE